MKRFNFQHSSLLQIDVVLPRNILEPFGPPMWQAEADAELTLSASPTTAVGPKALLHGTSSEKSELHNFVMQK